LWIDEELLMARIALILLFCFIACRSNPEHDQRIAAAKLLTKRYEQSRFAGWKLRARAAGADCDVLLVQTRNVLDDSLVEAMHYGGTDYQMVDGGVHQFHKDRAFRAVAYQDAAERVWTYGRITPAEGDSLEPCH
jgi:hypothetical protein